MMAEMFFSPGCLFYAIMFILPPAEGAIKFTLKPPNPSYARNGTDAKLVWDYSVDNLQAELQGIIYAVEVSGGGFVNMLGLHSDGTVANFPSTPNEYKGRVRIEGRASLVIKNVAVQDNTQFQCILIANPVVGRDVVSTIQLIVTVPTQFTALPKNLTVNETNSILLSCDASGFPEPSFTWTKNGNVLSESKQLNIQRSYRNNTGRYECTASNGVEQDKTATSFVTVQYPPAIKNVTASSVKSWIGQTVTLTCKSDGFPIPTITWHKPDGSQLDSNTAKESTVDVKMSFDQDFGVYKCVAGNGLAPADLKTVEIKQIVKPGFPTIGQLDIEATSLTVKWNLPTNDGGSPITAYRVVILKGSIEIKDLNITDPGRTCLSVGYLERDTEYTVKVFARNAVFEGPAGEKGVKTKYEVPPTITFKSKGKVTIVEGNVLYLFCEVKGNPKPLVTWRKSGRVLQSSISKTELIIHDARENDAGIYECEVSNSEGTMTYTVDVTIKGSSCNELVIHSVYITVILVLLIIILILIIVLRRLRSGAAIPKRNRKNICAGCGGDLLVLNTMASETKKQSSSIVPSGDSTTYAAPSSGDYMHLHPSARSWELNREQVKILKVIGKGAFSQVAKATAWNISGDEEYSTVAVKMLKANAPDSDRNDLLSELEVMKKLKPHPHVIKLMGCVTESDPLLVLVEYVPYGDLLGYLRKSRGLNDTYFKDPDVKPQTNLTAEQLMRFAWQIADGMFYLSSRKIIHRDLAARNVLVGEGEKCKVTDFGMARNVQQDDIYTKRSRGRLPVKWTAYEALLFGAYTTQSDVWSYGVLLYEILTVGGSPYPGVQAREIARKLQEGFRMPKPKHVDNKLYQIMLKCWEENPSDRPTFSKLKEMMKEIERNHRTYVNLKQYDNNLYANVEDLTAE